MCRIVQTVTLTSHQGMWLAHHGTVKPKGSQRVKPSGGRVGRIKPRGEERREERSVYRALKGVGSAVGSSLSQLLQHYKHQRGSEDVCWMPERRIYVNLLRIV